MKKLFIVFITILILIGCNKNNSISELELSANNLELLQNIDYTLEFTVSPNNLCGKVQLHETDKTSNNKVYDVNVIDGTFNFNIDTSESGTKTYYIEYNNIKSNDVTITIHSHYTYEEFASMEKVNDDIAELQETDEYKKSTSENKLEILEEELEQLTEDKLIEKDSIQYNEPANILMFNYSTGEQGGIVVGE